MIHMPFWLLVVGIDDNDRKSTSVRHPLLWEYDEQEDLLLGADLIVENTWISTLGPPSSVWATAGMAGCWRAFPVWPR